MTRLTRLSALVTGGGTGMRQAIALAFAREGAKVAVYLVSKESSWVTGAAIPLDGGLSAY